MAIKDFNAESYYWIIDKCAKEKMNFEISNGDSTHAIYLLNTFFKYAKKEICIYTGSLSDSIFGSEQLIGTAINFLKRDKDATVKIVFQESIDRESILSRKFIRSILDNKLIKNRLKVWTASSVFNAITNHFALMDGLAYRFETDHEQKKAIANFGDLASAETLKKAFSDIISSKNSKEIVLTC
jgi:hypothetical protein